MEQKDVLDWLIENPDEADKLRTLLVTKDEVLRRAATLLVEEADEDIIGPLTEKMSFWDMLRLKQQVELVMFNKMDRRWL